MASADKKPSPISWLNSVPITSHHGRSRNFSFDQQPPHKVPGCETCRRQPAQTGGNSSRAGHSKMADANALISCALSVTSFPQRE
jgi:hypothetical protein